MKGKLILIVFALCLIGQDAFSSQKLVLVGNTGNKPSVYKNNKGEIVGIDVDVIKEMAKRANITVEFRLVPWVRVLISIEDGLVDGGFPLFVTPERQKYSIYTQVPVHRTLYMAYCLQENKNKYNKLSDLYGQKVGKLRGISVSPAFDTATKNGDIELYEMNRYSQLLKMVYFKRLPVIVGKRSTVGLYLKKHKRKEVVGKALTDLDKNGKTGRKAFLVISKKSKIPNKIELLKKINRIMTQMKKDGTIERITRNYID
ncbi:MAG: amino acid ABC transporter substrate-binding protein [Desulfobacterales bacterium]|nr:amino acid ABC transporter substrate-binding protein [Desulfobacterales bacterium]